MSKIGLNLQDLKSSTVVQVCFVVFLFTIFEVIIYLQPVYTAEARKVFERAMDFYGDELMDESIFIAFAKLEEKCKEVK